MSVNDADKKALARKLWQEHSICQNQGDLAGAISKLKQAEGIFPGNKKVIAKRLRPS